jgi:hypothetical protein
VVRVAQLRELGRDRLAVAAQLLTVANQRLR